VFDGQVFQTPAWHRGMGKYSLEFIISLDKLNGNKKHWEGVKVILSKRSKTEYSVLETLKRRAPQVEIVELDLAHNEYDNRPVAVRNKKVLDDYLLSKINIEDISSIDYVVLSLMQSEVAPAFSSLKEVHNYSLFYDLIPLMFHRTYLTDAVNRKGYLSKLAELLKADTYLAISKTVANDLASILGVDKSRIMSIDGAPIPHGHKIKKIANVPKPFLLMPTGNDLRKNNRRGVKGFEQFNKNNNDKFHLVVTSVFQDFEISELKKLSDKVIFTGNVSGEELEYLYEETSALLFPTEYEGLGLPILEALEKNKPVACSDISVFREISDSAFFYFDAKDTASIADSLEKAVTTQTLPSDEYKRVLDKFTWQRTAGLFFDHARKHQVKKARNDYKLDLAFFCPSTDESSSGAEIQQLYSELSRLCSVNFYMDTFGKKEEKKINYLSQIAGVINIAQPNQINLPKTTLPIYYIENKPNCAAILMVALANPGVVVLTDTDLTKLWQAAADRKFIHPTRFDAEKVVNDTYGIKGILASLLANQKSVIVHEMRAKDTITVAIRKLPKLKRPKVVLISTPATQAVYPELKQNLSLYDYPGQSEKGKDNSSFRVFAEALVKEATNDLGPYNE
jgi:glycosyltransferase involved in cell wall biosynthesis